MDLRATSSTHPTDAIDYAHPKASLTVSLGDWLLTFLITCIPLVGLVMLLVWAFGSTTPPSKANWAKATLVLAVIFTALGFLFAGSLVALLMSRDPNFHL